MNFRNAFTMIELIFVIVVIGILAMVALPRMGTAVDDANIAKAKSDVATLRSVIASERQSRFLQGSSGFITKLDQLSGAVSADGDKIFDSNETNGSALLTYGVVTGSGEGQWKKSANNQYQFKSGSATATFDYNSTNGKFTCTIDTSDAGKLCAQIIN
ncbi:MAG: type II secretion system protein [Sulfuricurvum sp.]|nr:type II secretion system protein [Sulfuricurvum sp.]